MFVLEYEEDDDEEDDDEEDEEDDDEEDYEEKYKIKNGYTFYPRIKNSKENDDGR